MLSSAETLLVFHYNMFFFILMKELFTIFVNCILFSLVKFFLPYNFDFFCGLNFVEIVMVFETFTFNVIFPAIFFANFYFIYSLWVLLLWLQNFCLHFNSYHIGLILTQAKIEISQNQENKLNSKHFLTQQSFDSSKLLHNFLLLSFHN